MFEDNSPKLAGTVITLIVLAYVIYPMRVYTRYSTKTWGNDDTCMAAAMVSQLG